MNYEGQADQQRQVVPNALVSPLSLLCEIEIVDWQSSLYRSYYQLPHVYHTAAKICTVLYIWPIRL